MTDSNNNRAISGSQAPQAMTRAFKGIWIPAEIWLNPDLSITEKVMLVEIESLQDPVRGCYASNAYFAKFFGLSTSQVSRVITSLARLGFVDVKLIYAEKQITERQIRIRHANFLPSEQVNGIAKTQGGYCENAEVSNTKSNNTNSSNTEEIKSVGAEAPADANATAAPAKSPRFSPAKELLALGVEKQVVDDWLAIRKAKRQTLTLTALEQTKREAEKAGVTLNDAIKFSVQNSWAGFKASWMQNATLENLKQPAITRHTGFDQRDYTDGLIPNGDGSYSF
jgi:hypothetical protein